jgi:hypothetical protein
MERCRVSFVGRIDLNAEEAPAALEQAERLIQEVFNQYSNILGISNLELPAPYE